VRKRRHGDKAVASEQFCPTHNDQYQTNRERQAAEQPTTSIAYYLREITGNQCEQLSPERNIGSTKKTQYGYLDAFQSGLAFP
jgi:ribulose 1,5-bisphosphate carboxylase large subunit-like protein